MSRIIGQIRVFGMLDPAPPANLLSIFVTNKLKQQIRSGKFPFLGWLLARQFQCPSNSSQSCSHACSRLSDDYSYVFQMFNSKEVVCMVSGDINRNDTWRTKKLPSRTLLAFQTISKQSIKDDRTHFIISTLSKCSDQRSKRTHFLAQRWPFCGTPVEAKEG
jgi:hypothetical protein